MFDEQAVLKETPHIFRFGPERDVLLENVDYSNITPSQLTFERMLLVVGKTQDELEEHRYMLKQPCRHVVPIHTPENWERAIVELNDWTSRCLESEPEPKGIEIGPASMFSLHLLPPRAQMRLGAGAASADTEETLLPEDQRDWEKACHFFCHPFQDMEGVKLPNLTGRILPPAMVRIFRNLRSFTETDAQEYDEPFPELTSKTEVLQRMAVVALCWAAHDACKAATRRHQHQEAVQSEHHVRCFCVADGLTRKIVDSTTRGIHIVLAKDMNAVGQWIGAMTGVFTDEARRMAGAVFVATHPSSEPFDSNTVGDIDECVEQWLADLHMDDASRTRISSGSKMSMSELMRRGVLEGTAQPGQENLVMVLNLETINIKVFDESFLSQQTIGQDSVLVTRQLAVAGVEMPGGVWGQTMVRAVGIARRLADEARMLMISSYDERPKKPARQAVVEGSDDVDMDDAETQRSRTPSVVPQERSRDEIDDF